MYFLLILYLGRKYKDMFKKVIFGILTIGMLTGSTCDPQVMEDVLNTVIGTTITEQEAANGLKEALVQGATNGSDLLSVVWLFRQSAG